MTALTIKKLLLWTFHFFIPMNIITFQVHDSFSLILIHISKKVFSIKRLHIDSTICLFTPLSSPWRQCFRLLTHNVQTAQDRSLGVHWIFFKCLILLNFQIYYKSHQLNSFSWGDGDQRKRRVLWYKGLTWNPETWALDSSHKEEKLQSLCIIYET